KSSKATENLPSDTRTLCFSNGSYQWRSERRGNHRDLRDDTGLEISRRPPSQ
ncbi:hypothetical protein SERLA73DRAFT_188949, partial [Serpula lacrymans var. lacrymans S7.3]